MLVEGQQREDRLVEGLLTEQQAGGGTTRWRDRLVEEQVDGETG
jgi:hypothetical protein